MPRTAWQPRLYPSRESYSWALRACSAPGAGLGAFPKLSPVLPGSHGEGSVLIIQVNEFRPKEQGRSTGQNQDSNPGLLLLLGFVPALQG